MHTCAALSSGSGKAGIAVIRLSGDEAITIAQAVFFPANGKSLSDIPANTAVFGTAINKAGEKIDTGLALVFHAPHSYTGENSVEISIHGSPVGVSLLLAALFDAGAKPALPGEFTKRAFINGKLDLTQAEAVGTLLEAQSATELRLSSAQLEGHLGSKIGALAERINTMLASVYAYIDYPDEDLSDMSDDELSREIAAVKQEVSALSASYSSGLAMTKGVNTVLAGAPNTGKSTLFNLLAGFERAIVTDIAGTTRDVVSETVEVAGVKLHISDTAGLRDTEDTVEKIGVDRSKQALSDAELILAVFDVSQDLTDKDDAFITTLCSLSESRPIIAVLNKCDLVTPQACRVYKDRLQAQGLTHVLCLSAKSKDAKELLEQAVSSVYPADKKDIEAGLILTNARQHTALSRAADCLDRALNAIKTLTRDMAGLDLEEAMGALCEAEGKDVSEKVVDAIFSHFCVGK